MPVIKKDAPGNDPAATPPVDPPAAEPTQEPQPVDAPADVEDAGYHDSISGRPVTADGRFVDSTDETPVEPHRIVANDWPERQGR
jgi:hypothetical protein